MLAQIQHFRACPDDLPDAFGLPLHTTLSLLPGPVLELLHSHSFHCYLEELPSNVLYLAFHKIYLFLTQAEQCTTKAKPEPFNQLSTLLQPFQLGPVEVLRSWNHVLQFPCKGKEGKHGRHYIFSRWQVGGDNKWVGIELGRSWRVLVIWELIS